MRRNGFLLLAIIALSAVESRAQDIHRNSFSGKSTSFIKGEDNVKAEEKVHDLSADRSRSLPTSEHIKLNLAAGKNDINYAYYFYPTPAAPITEDLAAELWVHSNKSGIQLMARVVFPKERNPKQIDEPLTVMVLLDSYKPPAGGWQKLVLSRPLELLKAQQQDLRLKLRKDIDVTDAYIDRLVLNLYAGQGEIDVYLDNLEIGPVKPGAVPTPPIKGKEKTGPGKTVSKGKEPEKLPGDSGAILVDYTRGKLSVGGVTAFPRFIRYSGTPMQVLKEAGFNSLYMPVETPASTLEDAIDNYGFWIIPNIPPVAEGNNEKSPLTARDADSLVNAIRKFQSGDAVLFWDFGPVRSEDVRRVSRTVEAIRTADPKRPVGADVWDGFGKFVLPLQLIGTHRDPLMTSLELENYSQWLNQRKILASGSKFHWTWIQTHMPEWQAKFLYDRVPKAGPGFNEPIGPQPEQIRLLTYLAIASGCKGIGYWSDQFLADAYQGRDRLLQIALLNQEIEMLEPILLNMNDDVRWVRSSHPSVKVAIIRTNGKGLLAIPIWLGGGAQYVSPQGVVQGLTFTVPSVPDAAEPWEITPVRVQSLQNQIRLTPEGVQVTIPEFDLTAAVVFTSDNGPDGMIARWQKHTRRVSRAAASWACDLAEEQLRKVERVCAQLQEVAPPIDDVPEFMEEARRRLLIAKRERVANNDEGAYFDALRSLRPLRIVMRKQWEQATKTLDYPAASPYAVSYYTLPRHWELARKLRGAGPGASALNDGDFERAYPREAAGVAVSTLQGWTVQEVAIDEVVMDARIVPSAPTVEVEALKPYTPPARYIPTSFNKRIEPPIPQKPGLGNAVLRLRVGPKPVTLEKDEKAPAEQEALERVFLAVNSPPVKLPPGSWVRITGWMKIPDNIRASADGAMLYDTTVGEAYAVRLTKATEWKQFHFYRKVPENGEVRVRLALTGFGTAYFDDIRIEPLGVSDGVAGQVIPAGLNRNR